MEAVILAAGLGRGLEPITHTRPKPLVPVLSRTLLEVQLDALSELGGIRRVVVVASYMIEKVRDKVEELGSRYPFEVVVVDEGKPLGTAHALLKGLEVVRSEDVLVIYVDSIWRPGDLRAVVESSYPHVVTSHRVSDPRDYGVLVCDPAGLLKDVIEKPHQPISDVVNTGIYKFRADVAKYLERVGLSPRGEYELTDALKAMVSSGVPVKVLELSYWRDVGRAWRYLEFCLEVLREEVRGQTILGRVEDGVRVRGPVYIAETAEVLSGTYIEGPAFVGRGAVVGPNAYVRPGSVVMEGARIGFAVEVKGSVVMEGVHASHLSYIGDSVVSEHSNLGAGTILANLRLDGGEVKVKVKGVRVLTGRRKLGAFIGGHVRTGVNVSINPGVKVGAFSRILPGVVVYGDVPPCSIVKPDGSAVSLPREECLVDLKLWATQ